MSDGSIIYLKELRSKEISIEKRISELEKALQNPKSIDTAFMDQYKKLNNLRIDLKAVESRIYNYGKPRPGIEEYKGHEIKIN